MRTTLVRRTRTAHAFNGVRCSFHWYGPRRDAREWHAAAVRGIGDRLTIGERIAFYRARRGLTQTELANLVGYGPDWLSKIERGERPLRNAAAVDIDAFRADQAVATDQGLLDRYER